MKRSGGHIDEPHYKKIKLKVIRKIHINFQDISILVHDKDAITETQVKMWMLEFALQKYDIVKVNDGTRYFVKVPLWFSQLTSLLDWKHLALAGGFLVNMFTNDLDALRKGDLDIWTFDLPKETIKETLAKINEKIFDFYEKGWNDNCSAELKKNVLTIMHTFPAETPAVPMMTKSIQLIYDLKTNSPYEILEKFDLDNCKIAYSDNVFYADQAFIEYLNTGVIKCPKQCSEKTSNRIVKYNRPYNRLVYVNNVVESRSTHFDYTFSTDIIRVDKYINMAGGVLREMENYEMDDFDEFQRLMINRVIYLNTQQDT